MKDWQIDRYYQQTPCLCGATDTWHLACSANKTKEEVNMAYDRVYNMLRRRLAKERKAARKRCYGDGGERG